jgi:hypothetical protein
LGLRDRVGPNCVRPTGSELGKSFEGTAVARKSGESGHALALAAVIVGYALTALVIVAIVVFFIFIFTAIGVASSVTDSFSSFG